MDLIALELQCEVLVFNQSYWQRFIIRCITLKWSLVYQTQRYKSINTLRPRQNGRHFPDDIFKCIFLNEYLWISIFPEGPVNNIQALVQIMARSRSGDKPLSEPMMFSLLTHICVTRPQWVMSMVHLFYSYMWCWVLYTFSILSHRTVKYHNCWILSHQLRYRTHWNDTHWNLIFNV